MYRQYFDPLSSLSENIVSVCEVYSGSEEEENGMIPNEDEMEILESDEKKAYVSYPMLNLRMRQELRDRFKIGLHVVRKYRWMEQLGGNWKWADILADILATKLSETSLGLVATQNEI
uniref:Uncharacterized protein n=1 Tax=Glossina austeni TaxID=7395 RepID=A0A1A9VAD4_GLOAU